MNASPLTAPACSIDELQKLCDTLALQHAEVQRERDDFARQIAAMPRSSVDAEKALLSIRQARDTLLARNHELLGQLTMAENRHAELLNQHEDLTREHEAAMAELQALRQEVAEDARGRQQPLVTAMEKMAFQLASVTEERDDALSRAAELEARLEQCDAAAAAERDAFQAEIALLNAAAPPGVARQDPDLAALCESFNRLREDPKPAESLERFAQQLTAIAQRSQAAGLVAMQRLAALAADYVLWLCRVPAKIPNGLAVAGQALDLLDRLGAIASADGHPDPTGAYVYAVDDDVDNCECVSMAFEKIAFTTRYAIKPEAALAYFAAASCDLLILDVDMPGMSGLDLESRIREIPHHQATPIIFVSGHLSAADRIAELGNDLNHFVAKPYSLNELCLQALMLVVRSRLAALE